MCNNNTIQGSIICCILQINNKGRSRRVGYSKQHRELPWATLEKPNWYFCYNSPIMVNWQVQQCLTFPGYNRPFGKWLYMTIKGLSLRGLRADSQQGTGFTFSFREQTNLNQTIPGGSTIHGCLSWAVWLYIKSFDSQWSPSPLKELYI